MQQGQKRTLERDAYSETSSPKRAMSEDPAFASDGASSSASRSPPPRVAADRALALEPGASGGSPLQQLQQQQVAEGQMEGLHLSSDAAEAEDVELAVPAAEELASPLDADEAASSAATVVGPTPSASGSLPERPSAMSEELEADLAAEQQAEHDRSLSNAEKLAMVTNFKKQPLNVGDSWFLIDRKWYRRFAALLMESTEEPLSPLRPITNGRLLNADGQLLPDLQDSVDVEMVPESAWRLLVDWFGYDAEIKRKVISGSAPGNERVEFYEPSVHIHFILGSSDPKNLATTFQTPYKAQYSAALPYKVFLASVCRGKFHTSSADSRLWRFERGSGPYPAVMSAAEAKAAGAELLEPPTAEETVESMGIADGTILAVEWRGSPPGPWPMTGEASSASPAPATLAGPLFATPGYVSSLESRNAFASGSGSSVGTGAKIISGLTGMLTRSKASGTEPSARAKNGLMGLQNLGNTCFMNSAIQCMSNTTELNKYFLAGVYKDELNRSNPLGMKGQVADAFGDLITKLHYGSSSSYSPSDFKRTLARFAPSFSGYQQHDSQEFITFLLDGLHEDLNRIKKKPYVESPDWNGGGEAELAHLAKVCWDNYKKRNDSVIVDLFQGQYKSTLVCPKCSKVSITFDPFMYLTLPVPVKKKMEVEVFYVPATGKRFKVTLSVPKDASFRTVKQLIGQWFEKDPVTIFAAELWHGYFYKMFGDHDMIGEIASGDVIVFYEVATKLKTRHVSTLPADPDMFVIPVFTARAGARSENRYSNNSDGLVGAPFFVTVSRAEAASVDAITQAVVSQYARLLKDGDEGTLVTAAGPTDVSSGSDNTEDAIGEDDPDTLVTEIPLDPSLAAPSPPVADILFDDMATDSPPSSSVSASMTIATPSESTSPSSLPSEAVAGPSSRPVFTISVFSPRHRYGSVAGQIPDGKDLGGELFPLGTAYGNRSAARRLDTPDSDDELATAPTAAPIYLGPGTGIVCTWPDGVLDETLGPKSASAFDMGYETFVDPSIVAEAGKKRTKATLSIDDCLDEFSREETLGDDDLWYCSTCKEHQAATKKLELWKTPDILVVHLKRFGGSRGLRDKIDNLIEFPVTDFDLSPRVQERQIALSIEAAGGSTNDLGLESTKEPVVYDLYGVDQHFGGLGGGHYTAAAKSAEDGRWYSFDDSRVSSISDPHSVVTPAAYVLFYRRRVQTRHIGGETRVRVEAAIKSRAASAAASGTHTPTSFAPLSTDSGRASPSTGWTNFAGVPGMSGMMSGSQFNVTPSFSPPDSTGDPEYSLTTSSLSDAPSSRSPAGDDGLASNLLGATDSDDNDWMSSDLSTSPAGHPPLPAYPGPHPVSPAASDSIQLGAPLESHSLRAIDEDYDIAPARASTSASSSIGGDGETGCVMTDNDRSEASEEPVPPVAQPE